MLRKTSCIGFPVTLVGILSSIVVLSIPQISFGLSDDYRDVLARKYDLGYIVISFDGSRFTREVESEVITVQWKRADVRPAGNQLELVLPDVFLQDGTAIYSNAMMIPRQPGYLACPWSVEGVVQCVEYVREHDGVEEIVIGLRTSG